MRPSAEASGLGTPADAADIPVAAMSTNANDAANAMDATAAGATEAMLSRWLTRISLALAGQPSLRDDSLCIADKVVWWVHRFDADTPAAQVEAQLRRQLLACEMLSSQDLRPPAVRSTFPASLTPHGVRLDPGRTAAGAAERLQALRRG
uniref:Uncharacterized protein n=2 Tax=Pandoraea faecigallinarum TaxID=656179 RepID=A0A0H3WSS8_9BURK